MKKFLLCMMLAGLMMPAIAQEKMAKEARTVHAKEMADLGIPTQTMLPTTSRGTLVDVGLWKVAGITESYDRQTQGSVYPMTKMHDDGFIGCTWTNEDNPPLDGFANPICFRGLGYSYSTDGGATWSWSDPDNPEYQENRLGGIPLYWPSYAQWGPHGEAVLGRSADTYTYEHNGTEIEILNGLVLLTRENKGQGEWNIHVVPYPEGYTPNPAGPGIPATMAWARMATSGPNHQYLHIMTPIRITSNSAEPTYYYRTQDGGATWDVSGMLISELVGHEWDPDTDGYTDGINFAVRGNTVACVFANMGSDGYVLKSYDNGDTWQSTTFFDSPVRIGLTPADYSDSVYIPVQACIALDLNDKVHVAFAVVYCINSDDRLSYYSGLSTSFLSYWNESMGTIDGDAKFRKDIVEPFIWDDYFDWDNVDENNNLWPVMDTIPKMPVIGYYTPISGNIFHMDYNVVREWAGSYGPSGGWSFPQMAFDADNVLHLVYLGFLDNGEKDGKFLRHPFYLTTADEGLTWTRAEHLVNFVMVIDQEFAYLTLAGIGADNKMYLMVQTDNFPGVYEAYVNPGGSDHGPTKNNYYFFTIADVPCPDCPDDGIVENTVLSMQLFPNPASGQVRVTFEGKGNITLYNMLGQTVYHVENVENHKDIPLNMASGVYFVTVRSGNATATQKLVVK